MRILNYSEWRNTAHIMHMILQMMGKVKLMRSPAQPEWNQVVLYPTAKGFTTGIVPHGDRSFDIQFNIAEAKVQAQCLDGNSSEFSLRPDASVAEYFDDFHQMLVRIGTDVDFNPKPQETEDVRPFDQQTKRHYFSREDAMSYFKMCIFAHNALQDFAAPFRGKKIMPALFWGTFDMTTILFAGEDRPYEGTDIIGKVAFDEKFVEFGFWPGDANVNEPHLFILPYPFTETDYSGVQVRPKEAYFDPEKREFFVPFGTVMRQQDPALTIRNFCTDVFDILAGTEDWENIDWFNKPLLV